MVKNPARRYFSSKTDQRISATQADPAGWWIGDRQLEIPADTTKERKRAGAVVWVKYAAWRSDWFRSPPETRPDRLVLNNDKRTVRLDLSVGTRVSLGTCIPNRYTSIGVDDEIAIRLHDSPGSALVMCARVPYRLHISIVYNKIAISLEDELELASRIRNGNLHRLISVEDFCVKCTGRERKPAVTRPQRSNIKNNKVAVILD